MDDFDIIYVCSIGVWWFYIGFMWYCYVLVIDLIYMCIMVNGVNNQQYIVIIYFYCVLLINFNFIVIGQLEVVECICMWEFLCWVYVYIVNVRLWEILGWLGGLWNLIYNQFGIVD